MIFSARMRPAAVTAVIPSSSRTLGLLANAQPADNGCKEVQRPELRLFPKADRAVHSERQRQAADKRGGMPELVQRAQLGFQSGAAGARINVIVLRFKAAVDPLAHAPVHRDRLLVGAQIQRRRLGTEAAEQLIVQQPVLRGDFGRRAGGDAGGDPVRFDEQHIHACVREQARAEQSRDAAADDQHIGADVARSGSKRGRAAVAVQSDGLQSVAIYGTSFLFLLS